MVDLAVLEEGSTASLEAIQNLDPGSVARPETLGKAFDFTSAVPTVVQIVQYFRLFPKDLLLRLPETQYKQVISHADVIWGTIQLMLRFNPEAVSNPANERQGLVALLTSQYSDTVGSLGPSLALVSALQGSSSSIEAEIKAVLEEAKGRNEAAARLEQETAETTARILKEVRGLAAEAGVSHEATHFGDEAGSHSTAAKDWQKYTNWTAVALILFAVIAWGVGYAFEPKSAYQAIQLGLSKLLIFSTLAYMLFLCGRTLMAHRHNEVVNKHRQNALLTFNALTEAAGSEHTKDVVLTHASSCIYAPQESGFSKAGNASASPSLVEVIPRVMGQSAAN